MSALKIALWPEIDLAAVRASLLEDERGIYGVGLTIGDAIVCTQDFTGQNCAPGIFLRGQSPFMDRGQSPVLEPISLRDAAGRTRPSINSPTRC